MPPVPDHSQKTRPPFKSTRLLDQLRERIRYLHYSLRTEEAYVYWARGLIRWSGLRHPRALGSQEVEAYLSYLANARKVSASTHHQALSAILFLYREVLGIDLPWMTAIGRPTKPKRIPVVLAQHQVAELLANVHGETGLAIKLLYGTRLRLMECLRLRVKDVDSASRCIVVRESKGKKDRVVMLPASLQKALRAQGRASRELWDKD